MCRPKIILSMTARKDTFEAYATVCGGSSTERRKCTYMRRGVIFRITSKLTNTRTKIVWFSCKNTTGYE